MSTEPQCATTGGGCAGPAQPMTITVAHRIMQRHRGCTPASCAARRAARDLLVLTGRVVPDARRRHVRIWFPANDIRLDFQCDVLAAAEFARRMLGHPRAHVAVDTHLDPDLPPLPCVGLWSDHENRRPR
ncbi:hypothetical protein ACWEKT_29240 [Nocardia takedensis]